MFKYLFIITMACVTLITNVSFANPLTDYSKGKTVVDINWYPSMHLTNQYAKQNSTSSGTGIADGKKGNFDFGVTTGINGKWALQYRQFNPETEIYANDKANLMQQFGMKTQEINVLYKLDKNLSAFAGWHQASYTYGASINPNIIAQNKNILQVGLVGSTQIATKTHLFGIVGVGKDLFNIETGIAYEVAKSVELNLVYRYKKLNNLEDTTFGHAYQDTVTSEGWGLGITYKL